MLGPAGNLTFLCISLAVSLCHLRELRQPRAWLRYSLLFSSVSVVSRCSPTALCHPPLVLLHTVPQFAANKQKQLSTALCLVSRLPAAAATSRCRSRVFLCICNIVLVFAATSLTNKTPCCALIVLSCKWKSHWAESRRRKVEKPKTA